MFNINEIAAYLAVITFNACYKLASYALLAGSYCSGPGTGATRFYRVCQDRWLLLTIVLDMVVLFGFMRWMKGKRLSSRWKYFLWGMFLFYLIFLPIVWETSFFFTSTVAE